MAGQARPDEERLQALSDATHPVAGHDPGYRSAPQLAPARAQPNRLASALASLAPRLSETRRGKLFLFGALPLFHELGDPLAEVCDASRFVTFENGVNRLSILAVRNGNRNDGFSYP